MLTPERAIKLLHIVNLQINSNEMCIKPNPSLNLLNRFNLMVDTRRSLKKLYESYPAEKLNVRTNLLSSIALLYSQFRAAVSEEDEPMLHRYLTNGLYQQWKDNKKEAFKVYSFVADMKISQAQLYQNEYGKWIQCLVKMRHDHSIIKEHIVERKLDLMANSARSWYFIKFQN